MSADFQVLFDQLVNERGGKQALGVVGLSIARSLAVALSDPTTPPSIVASLSASLPVPKPGEAAYDLRILSTAELRELDYLLGRAAGAREARPPRVRRSRREEEALALAQFVDAISRRDKKTTDAEEFQIRKYPKLTDAETIQIRNHIHYVLRDVADPNQIYSYLAWRPAPAAVTAPAAVVESEATPSAPVTTDNVVPLTSSPKLSVHGDGAPVKRGDEVWRGQSRQNIT